MGLVTTLSIDVKLNSIECHYAECRDYLNVMLSVVMLNVVRLSVVAPLSLLTSSARGRLVSWPKCQTIA